MTRILREAAEVRDGLERARSAEDSRLVKEQAEAYILANRLLAGLDREAPFRLDRT